MWAAWIDGSSPSALVLASIARLDEPLPLPPTALRPYRAKRDFSITSEPSGTAPPPPDGWRFVVQRHRATRLHYDLRLEVAGVLASWAVPKGPTLDPAVKRMAVHVEDHPLDYFDFEGVIPAGEYGGGDVIVWDWGRWALADGDGDDPLAAIEAGNLHFDLDGEKLRGRFVLVQRGGDRRGRPQWLLLKKRDEAAEAGWDPEDHPRSVRSGRTNDEVAAAPAASWSSEASWAAPTADELGALDSLGAGGRWRIGGQAVALSGLDDVLVPKSGSARRVTRRDVVRHVATTAPAMLPYVHDHWLAHPAPSSAPAWMPRVRAGSRSHLTADSPAALAWLAARTPLDLRASMAAPGAPDRPTWAIIEVPAGPSAGTTLGLLRTALDHLGLEGRPVVGGACCEVRIPIAPRQSYDDVGAWLDQLSAAIAATVPDAPPPRRADATTFVVPFAPLDAPGAPVVVPLGWDELDDDTSWTITDIGDRLARSGDPLAPLIGLDQRLPRL